MFLDYQAPMSLINGSIFDMESFRSNYHKLCITENHLHICDIEHHGFLLFHQEVTYRL